MPLAWDCLSERRACKCDCLAVSADNALSGYLHQLFSLDSFSLASCQGHLCWFSACWQASHSFELKLVSSSLTSFTRSSCSAICSSRWANSLDHSCPWLAKRPQAFIGDCQVRLRVSLCECSPADWRCQSPSLDRRFESSAGMPRPDPLICLVRSGSDRTLSLFCVPGRVLQRDLPGLDASDSHTIQGAAPSSQLLPASYS
jgi:hypothetical protein